MNKVEKLEKCRLPWAAAAEEVTFNGIRWARKGICAVVCHLTLKCVSVYNISVVGGYHTSRYSSRHQHQASILQWWDSNSCTWTGIIKVQDHTKSCTR
ncbi:hypothetical protein E2C01_081118 [Portunus trituberculatus]|uniref:Uncharacterized protein n=1 Tax=Portunus trituberculatus TaxID=210409 RepID=A0A5B7IUY5_PORTR|nr:hypothetical protein [Portunus trituberculatus]